MSVGANPVLGFHLTVGGTSQFGWVRINQNITAVGTYWVDTNGRIFQRADAFNSLNVVSTSQINFSLQSDRATDQTTGTIAFQLDDTNGIAINRAVVNNQTFNSIGNVVGEANVIAWGKFALQNAGEIREVLDTKYKMYVRNGDQAGELNLVMGLESSVPENTLTDARVTLLGHLDITHATFSTIERFLFNNPDADGMFIFSLNSGNKFDIGQTTSNLYGNLYVQNNIEMGSWLDITHTTESGGVEVIQFNNSDTSRKFVHSVNSSTKLQVTESGVDVVGTLFIDVNGITSDGGGVFADALTASAFNTASDFRLKENIKEIPTKACYDIVKYVRVKEFNMKGKENKQVGCIAQDVMTSKIDKEWSNFVSKGKDDF